MALLQIAEPGRAAAPHQHRLAVGIDLGTTNSLVATVRSAVPTVLPDAAGRLLLPSVVHYGDEDQVLIGDAARERAAEDPGNTIASSKRLIGRAMADVRVERGPITVVVDAMSLQYLMGAEIDYEDNLEGARFVIRNPNASSTCGCGSSFSV